MEISPLVLTDSYKISNNVLLPPETNLVYANLTPRRSRVPGVDGIVFFGLQYYLKRFLIDHWYDGFFSLPKDVAINMARQVLDSHLPPGSVDYSLFADLWELGYLPLRIKALPEGTVCPIGVPCMTVRNTHPKFAWLTNYIESHMSGTVWGPCTSATTAFTYRRILGDWAERTGSDRSAVLWQAHDFSLRGLPGLDAAMSSGAAHLLSFRGTDSIPALCFLREYYGAQLGPGGDTVGCSVAASEHSVMCMGTQAGELETFRRAMTEVYPTGILALVSDTWDLWNVVGVILPALKDAILGRDGTLVIRPDSGDPVRILTGYTDSELLDPEVVAEFVREGRRIDDPRDPKRLGLVESLWNLFGGTVNALGYRVLDRHIGAIYGDSITTARADEICARLALKGFVSTSSVLGVGSYSYQMVTRDTFGFAVKSTYGEVGGTPRPIFKDPITDDGTKRSLRGLLRVDRCAVTGKLVVTDGVSCDEEDGGALVEVFCDGILTCDWNLSQIRGVVEAELVRVGPWKGVR